MGTVPIRSSDIGLANVVSFVRVFCVRADPYQPPLVNQFAIFIPWIHFQVCA